MYRNSKVPADEDPSTVDERGRDITSGPLGSRVRERAGTPADPLLLGMVLDYPLARSASDAVPGSRGPSADLLLCLLIPLLDLKVGAFASSSFFISIERFSLPSASVAIFKRSSLRATLFSPMPRKPPTPIRKPSTLCHPC